MTPFLPFRIISRLSAPVERKNGERPLKVVLRIGFPSFGRSVRRSRSLNPAALLRICGILRRRPVPRFRVGNRCGSNEPSGFGIGGEACYWKILKIEVPIPFIVGADDMQCVETCFECDVQAHLRFERTVACITGQCSSRRVVRYADGNRSHVAVEPDFQQGEVGRVMSFDGRLCGGRHRRCRRRLIRNRNILLFFRRIERLDGCGGRRRYEQKRGCDEQ